jgi:hypothetical protein
MMHKEQIIAQLTLRHADFSHFLSSLDEVTYLAAAPDKWNAGQQLDHIVRSIQPVNMAFGLPHFVLRLLFGTANRPSRSYEEVVARYQAKLAQGGRASGRFVPPKAIWEQRGLLLTRLEKLIQALNKKIEKMPDNQLDTLLLPHPLLGKMTLREMLYFSIYHVQHHQANIHNHAQ